MQSGSPPISDVLNQGWVGKVYSEVAFSSPSFTIQYVFGIIVSITYQYDLFI